MRVLGLGPIINFYNYVLILFLQHPKRQGDVLGITWPERLRSQEFTQKPFWERVMNGTMRKAGGHRRGPKRTGCSKNYRGFCTRLNCWQNLGKETKKVAFPHKKHTALIVERLSRNSAFDGLSWMTMEEMRWLKEKNALMWGTEQGWNFSPFSVFSLCHSHWCFAFTSTFQVFLTELNNLVSNVQSE